MSHSTIEELLAMREDLATQTTRRHLAQCPSCRARLEELYQVRARLRALPSIRPSRDLWPTVRDRWLEERRGLERRRRTRVALALAATLLLSVAGWWGAGGLQGLAERRRITFQVADLRERSQLLDAELRSVQAGSVSQSGWRAQAILEVEDRIAALDSELRGDGIERPTPSAVELWRTRVELQGTLLRLHLEPVALRTL